MSIKPKPSILKQLAFAVPTWIGMIASVLIIIYVTEAPVRKEFVESFFNTSVDQVNIMPSQLLNHGKVDFTVSAKAPPLKMRDDRGISKISLQSGTLGKETEDWMTDCYYQSEDPYLDGVNGNIWIYTDKNMTKAKVIGRQAGHMSVGEIEREFEKIFDNPFDKLNFGDCYRRANKIYFHVYSPESPLKFRSERTFKPLDINAAADQVHWPPRQKREEWMKRVYTCSIPATGSDAAETFLIFRDDKAIETFVIAEHLQEGKSN